MLNDNHFERDTAIDLILPSLAASGGKEIAGAIVEKVFPPGYSEASVQALVQDLAEELARSGIGTGVGVAAIKTASIKNSLSILVRLKDSVDVAAPDNVSADIICVLLYPEAEAPHYLRRLSRLTRLLRNPDLCAKLRETQDIDTMRSLLHSPEGWTLAA